MKTALLLLFVLGSCRTGQTVPESAKNQTPFGSWVSSITADDVAKASLQLGAPMAEDGAVYWLEGRPADGGQVVIVRWTAEGGAVDLLPKGFSARTRVHGYGGGAYTVAGGTAYFSNYDDQRIYSVRPGEKPIAITAESSIDWFADFVVDPKRNRLLAIRERKGDKEPIDSLVSIALDSGEVSELHSGPNFMSSPRISADGTVLAFVTWDHPNMPWDTTTLWRATVSSDGGIGQPTRVAGGSSESVTQPSWTPDGKLMFISDRTGWWNLYLDANGSSAPIFPREAEFARPPWVLGRKSYALAGDRLIASFTERGRWSLADVTDGKRGVKNLAGDYQPVGDLSADGHVVVFVGASPTEPMAVIRVDLKTGLHKVLRRASERTLSPEHISRPEHIEFPSEGGVSYGFYYPPTNPTYRASGNGKPPLLVRAHGGPTSAARFMLDMRIQFWTSRGFAVVDVNYRGSTGYGREYRQALYGGWGDADVEDLAAAVRFLAARGNIDSARVAVAGGSAGGFSVLNALIHHPEFAAGAMYYGITDLELLAKETHKFESRYGDQLIGPYPEAKALYKERSPINKLAKLTKPLVLFHGLEDKVVPPNQAELLCKALKERDIGCELHLYKDEGHGFRRSENIKASLEAELAFYSRVFKLTQ